MKFALFVVAILALLWLLRGTRRRMPPPAQRPGPEAAARPMLSCAQCGLHLPRDEALPGRGGVFCSEAHRKAFEQGNTGP